MAFIVMLAVCLALCAKANAMMGMPSVAVSMDSPDQTSGTTAGNLDESLSNLLGMTHLHNALSSGHNTMNSLRDLDAYLDNLLALSNLHIAKMFSAETRRYKRSLDMNSVRIIGTEPFTLLSREPSKFNETSFKGVKGMHCLSKGELDYWVLTYNGKSHAIIETKGNLGMKLVARFETSAGINDVDYIASLLKNGKLLIAMASSFEKFVSVVHVDVESGSVSLPHVLVRPGLVGGLHMFETVSGVYLVIGSSQSLSENGDPITASLYKLSGNYFDEQESLGFSAKNVTDIAGFSDHGNYYIVFGMIHSQGSEVYKFDSLLHSMTLVHQLPVPSVVNVLHFFENQESKHYVVMNNGVQPKLYRWGGGQLLLWQDLDVSSLKSPIGDVKSFSVSTLETFIIIANGDSITIFADDISAHFVVHYNQATNCNSIGNVEIVQLGDSFVVFYICKENLGGSRLQYLKVLMEEIRLEKPKDTNQQLFECLEEVSTDLDSRKPTIRSFESILKDDLLMTTDKTQNWSAPISFVNGLTVNGTTSFLQMVNISSNKSVLANSQTFGELVSATTKLEENVTLLGVYMEDLLYHNGNQEIRGSIKATSLLADAFESNATKIRQLNGHALLSMEKEFLIDGIDQEVSSSMTFHTLSADTFSTRGKSSFATINGVATNQFMRKSESYQRVTGSHTYKNIHASSISGTRGKETPLVLNGVDTSTIVTRGSRVTFSGEKTLTNMTVLQNLNVSLLNDVDLSTLKEKLIFKNLYKTQTLSGNFTLHDLKVVGNVNVTLINGVNLKQLDSMVVKKAGGVGLKGNVNYQNISVSSLTAQKLNNILWENIVSRNTATITGNYDFKNVTVQKAIRCDSVNGLDISKDVVTTNTDQILHGNLTFVDDVFVTGPEGIRMSDSSTINKIDPRSLHTDHLGNLLIKTDLAFNNSLKVSGHVMANTINGLDMTDIENRYWRKSTNQEIEVMANLSRSTFNKAVTAKSINKHQMSDYFTLTGPQIITGNYTFQAPVKVIGDLDLAKGKTVAGVDVSALNKNLVTLGDAQTINAKTTLKGKLTIDNDLTVNGRLDGWNVTSDFMRLDQTVAHKGELKFMNKIRGHSLFMNKSNLQVSSLNGLDVKAAKDDLVLVNENAEIAGPLAFLNAVTVNALGSRWMDGVDLNDLASRSLKKRSSDPQNVTGRISTTNVHFHQSPKLNLVNDKNWNAHLGNVVPLDYNGAIHGLKTFTDTLVIKEEFHPEVINGVINITALAPRILTKTTEQTITKRYTFNSSITASNLNASVIDGVATSHLLLVDQEGTVGGTVAFKENVFMTDITTTTGILDGCNVTKLNETVLKKLEDGSLNVSLPITVGKLVVKGNLTAKSINAGTAKRDLEDFFAKIVTKSTDQQITGDIEFITDVKMKNLTANYVDGVDVNKVYKEMVLNNEEVVIKCDMNFVNGLSVESLSVSSDIGSRDRAGMLINGLNMSKINEHAVRKTGGPYVMTGRKTFANGLTTQNLSVDASLNDVPVINLALVSKPTKFADGLTFQAPITVKGNLQVDGLLDGIDLDQMLSNRIRLDSNETLQSSTTFNSIEIEGNLEVDTINGIKYSDILLKTGRAKQEIIGLKTFSGGLHVIGEIEAPLVNGLDIKELGETVVRRDQSSKIKKPLIFQRNLTSSVPITVQGKVNGYDLSELDYDESRLKESIQKQSTRLSKLNSTLANIHFDAQLLACGMYETIAYGKETGSHALQRRGKISGNSTHLYVRACNDELCICSSQTDKYLVDSNGSINFMESKYDSILQVSDEQKDVIVTTNCDDKQSTIEWNTMENSRLLPLDNVIDAAVFTVSGDINHTYVVTVSAIKETTVSARTFLKVTRLDPSSNAVVVWSLETAYSATSVDMIWIDQVGRWFMLVANNWAVNKTVDPYIVPSQLFMWEEEKFHLTQQYMAQHVSSGMFLKSKAGTTENFISLAQLKEAQFELYSQNLKYNTEVVIMKYFKNFGFVSYQNLKSFGVIAQASMYVGNDLYLVLLSMHTGTLDVYYHRPSQGFLLHHKISVCKRPIDLKSSGDTSFWVSCSDPPQLIGIKFEVKGFSYFE